MKTLQSFTISGTTCSTRQQHIPEDWSLQRYCAHHKGIVGSRGIAPPFLNHSKRWTDKWSASSPGHFDSKG